MSLKTDYKDSVYSQKLYHMTNIGSDVMLEDVTVYSQEGNYYGAENLNAQNREYNAVENDYNEINRLISRFAFYGITVSDKSPNGIKNALDALALAKYTEGKNSGVNYVKTHTSEFNLVSAADYNVLANKARAAANKLMEWIPYSNGQPTPGLIYSDPITNSEARSVRNVLSEILNDTRSAFTTFYNQALTNLATAKSYLNV